MADSKTKRQGDWVEALFMARATALGLNVARPWGSALAYDFLVEADGHTCRVQVKSCSHKRSEGGYSCNLCNFGRPLYTIEEFEFAAIYVIPKDRWYIIPMAALPHVSSTIVVRPNNPKSKYHPFEEAWHLLSGRESRATGSQ